MSKPSILPNATVGLGYLAAGAAMSVSYIQIKQILAVQGGIAGSDYVSLVLPMAILLGAAALWRMSGHLYGLFGGNTKSMGMAFAFVMLGAVFNEGISVFTSAMSLTMGINQKISNDAGSVRTDQNRNSLSSAIGALSASMKSADADSQGELARRMEALVSAESGMADRADNTQNSVTQKTFDEFAETFGTSGQTLKTVWAWLVAIAMSLIVMAVQVGNGSLASGAKKMGGVNP